MARPETPSLQARLAWRLGLVLVGSLSLVVATLLYYVWSTLDDLDDASLQIQAQQIAHSLSVTDGEVALSLPTALERAYRESGDGFMFAIAHRERGVLAVSSAKARELIEAVTIPPLSELPLYFRLPGSSGGTGIYQSMIIPVEGQRDLAIIVAQGHLHEDVLGDTVLVEIYEHLGWTLPVILLSALAIAIWTIRTSLTPLNRVSARAAGIGPEATDVRLPIDGVPREIQPLVEAINAALGRLESGFVLQRQFTANAAHELRTPLAVLTARLDELESDEISQEFSREMTVDIARMNRLVGQLLRVSRLDASEMDVSAEIDVGSVARDVVSYMAPLALARGLSISFANDGPSLRVLGNRAALEDAVRNLVENALDHSPPGGEVTVEVSQDQGVAVRDQGPGIPAQDRDNVFQRFWRGRGARHEGAGLGLAIVTEIARAHHGRVTVSDNEGGGAVFGIIFPGAGT